ncbi:uncharacterized protein LOC122142017 [Cyprinus carpio]|uniref:Uncharacterized protein LOC122142017 n=1 Tax=Cyprinus carpio TaxID=7962 RepID=A0A9R0AQA1_CYPCA|nr:uncharacterized protein LOC122142017 [Cyprinus carpio]
MKMDQVTERLIEEVRKYSHLYDSSSGDYKDCQMAANSWREISSNVDLDVAECMKRWKNSRDKYVRLRKKLTTRSGDPGGKKIPAFYLFLSWLAPHVKHRFTESNFDDKDGTDTSSNSTGLSDVRPPANSDDDQLPSGSPHHHHLFRPPVQEWHKKRKRKEIDDWVQVQVARLEAQLEERRVELQQRLCQGNDESDRFGQTVADMLRRVPEDHRAQAMFRRVEGSV